MPTHIVCAKLKASKRTSKQHHLLEMSQKSLPPYEPLKEQTANNLHQQMHQQQRNAMHGAPHHTQQRIPPPGVTGPPPPYMAKARPTLAYAPRMPQEISVVMRPPLGMDPKLMICPRCRSAVYTKTKATPGLLTYILSTLLCMCGCVFGCCLIPLCIDEAKDREHRCPRCRFYFGKHRLLM